MATGHRDGKVRIWSLQSRKVENELRASEHSQLTSICCTGYDNNYVLACARDDRIYKLDTRQPQSPVCVFEDDHFSCLGRRTRISLSANRRYAVVASAANKLVIFDLQSEEKHSTLSHDQSIIDCQWVPGRNRISALDKSGQVVTWVVPGDCDAFAFTDD